MVLWRWTNNSVVGRLDIFRYLYITGVNVFTFEFVVQGCGSLVFLERDSLRKLYEFDVIESVSYEVFSASLSRSILRPNSMYSL